MRLGLSLYQSLHFEPLEPRDPGLRPSLLRAGRNTLPPTLPSWPSYQGGLQKISTRLNSKPKKRHLPTIQMGTGRMKSDKESYLYLTTWYVVTDSVQVESPGLDNLLEE
jgi:hypothetical protein